MMGIFDGLGKKVGEAAQAAAKKSGELMEITKLNMNVSSEEEKIQKLYVQLGKKVYSQYCTGCEIGEDFKQECDQIKSHESNIGSLKQKILEIKNIKVCSTCNAEIDANTLFCGKCGAKQEPEVQLEPVKESTHILCPACNMQVEKESAFCTSCGARMG